MTQANPLPSAGKVYAGELVGDSRWVRKKEREWGGTDVGEEREREEREIEKDREGLGLMCE